MTCLEEKTMRRITPVFALLIIAMPILAHSAQPLDVLKVNIDQVIGILQNSQHEEAAQDDLQQEKIWKTIQKVFDFKEMAKRAAARDWRNFTKQQKEKFSNAFAKFLGNTYLNKIQKGYRDEKVIYLSQELITDSKGRVKTKILREDVEIPVVYSMQKQNGTWRIYDVNIEGVSLVKNYRAQFSKILSKKSPDQLIEMLKKKIEKQKKR